jgi:hypothetical protein
MLSVIKTTSGGFNVVATEDGMFTLQGHVSEAQLKELIIEAKKALKS